MLILAIIACLVLLLAFIEGLVLLYLGKHNGNIKSMFETSFKLFEDRIRKQAEKLPRETNGKPVLPGDLKAQADDFVKQLMD